MKYLLLTRGMPLSGKSEWIRRHGLLDYTLDIGMFKALLRSPVLDENGKFTKDIAQSEKGAFAMLFSALESRMAKGDFVIVEDSHISKSYFSNYKELAKVHNYRIFVVDFSSVELDEIKRRSLDSKYSSRYTDAQLKAMHTELKEQEIPIKCDVIAPDDIDKILNIEPKNLNGYKVIHHIGDIQGSFSVLKKYINKIKDDEFYIFLGDYIDRGFQNYEVLKFLMSIMDRKNVWLLEGNHERWLFQWASDREVDSREFRLNTQVELESKGFTKQEAKRFYNKLQPFLLYRFHDKRVVCTHGGLSNMPSRIALLSVSQCVHGVGDYLSSSTVARSFSYNVSKEKNSIEHTDTDVMHSFKDIATQLEDSKNTHNLTNATLQGNYYQFFGHRNKSELPICVYERNFILEAKVEFGGYLRAVQLSQNGFKDCSIKNTIFISKQSKESKHALQKYFDSIDRHNNRVRVVRWDFITKAGSIKLAKGIQASFNSFNEGRLKATKLKDSTKSSGLQGLEHDAKLLSLIKNLATIHYPPKPSKDILYHPLSFAPSVIDVKEWRIAARGYGLAQNLSMWNLSARLDDKRLLNELVYPLKIMRCTRGVQMLVSYYNGELIFYANDTLLFGDGLLDFCTLPMFLESHKATLCSIFKNHSYSMLFSLDSKEGFVLSDIICNEPPINSGVCSYDVSKVSSILGGQDVFGVFKGSEDLKSQIAQALNIRSDECILVIDSKEEFREFLEVLKRFNYVGKLQSLRCNDSKNIKEILESNKFYRLSVFDSNHNFIHLPMYYDGELEAISQLIKIWRIQDNVSKLPWINNAFREAFFAWFKDFSENFPLSKDSKTCWKSEPIKWIQNAFLHSTFL